MQQQPYERCSFPLTSSTAGLRNDKQLSARTCMSHQRSVHIITLGVAPLKEDVEAIYFGVTFDKGQAWTAEAKARCRLTILPKLTGTTCEASVNISEKKASAREQYGPISTTAPQRGQPQRR